MCYYLFDLIMNHYSIYNLNFYHLGSIENVVFYFYLFLLFLLYIFLPFRSFEVHYFPIMATLAFRFLVTLQFVSI